MLKTDRKKQRTQDAEAEAEVLSQNVKKALSLAKYSAREWTAEELVKAVRTGTDTILHCAKRSGNIKGVFHRNFNDAAALILAAVESLAERTLNEETRRLNEANRRLTNELEDLRKELSASQEHQRQTIPDVPSASNPMEVSETQSSQLSEREQFEREIIAKCGVMMSARIEGLKDRLLPEKRRIPLAADRRRDEASNDTNLTSLAPKNTATSPHIKPVEPQPSTSGVGSNKSAKKAAQKDTERPQQTSDKPAKAKTAAQKLRPPRSSAIVLTLMEGAEEKGVSYQTIIRDARSRINIEEIGIASLKFAKAKTGGKLLEIPGSTSGDKADVLANKLKEILPADLVRVTRPVKTADVRISGLDDATTSDEVAAAVAKAGGCVAEAIRVGEIRQTFAGSGSVVVKVPVAVAKKIGQGRLLVGWVSARVQVLENRPMRCFRCLEGGHVRAQCQAETDRSELCYRCGRPEHKAKNCSAAPHCSVCAAYGKQADHKAGGKNCSPPKPRRKAAKPVAQISAGQVEEMDTAK
ncbi:hypothetical protein ABMA27_010811 [Loxostege sticticalis]|uniref:CCHC-type domain-containing protein n=1 Tax=Loxostege sticticalis TaxID=481309 RepID=A0ABR3H4T0_LOXSC